VIKRRGEVNPGLVFRTVEGIEKSTEVRIIIRRVVSSRLQLVCLGQIGLDLGPTT